MAKSRASSSSQQLTPKQKANLRHLVDYSSTESMSQIWSVVAEKFKDIVALHAPHNKPEVKLTYAQLNGQIRQFAAGLQALGIKPESKIALFADNSPRWFIADQGMIMAGAVNVVRSAGADREELLYILSNSESTSLAVDDLKTLKKLHSQLDDLPIALIVLLSDEEPDPEASIKTVNFQQLIAAGADHTLEPVEQHRDTLATLLYTSGTTGKPKGVMLSHGNLLHQVTAASSIIQPQPGDRVLSILPSWHAYERACEYFFLAQGCTQIYTNLRSFKKDLQQFKPHYMVGVPRLWESIYEGVQKQFRDQPETKQKLINFFLDLSESYVKARRIAEGLSLDNDASASQRALARAKATALQPLHTLADQIVYQKVRENLGGNVKTFLSGGGSLAMHIDTFFEIVGVPLLVGYGLTETSPITNARLLHCNLRGSAGRPFPQTEIRIADPQTRQTLPQGEKGLVLIRGPQVMQGYYKNPEATAKAIDADGWFDSGDLGLMTPTEDLVLTGRAKDTIVLSNGENIEPQPIEDACARSPYIDQIMVVGQDQRSLGALIVPNLEALQKWAEKDPKLQLPNLQHSENQVGDLNSKPIRDLFRQELNREVKNRPGYRPDDRIGPFEFITEPFSIDNGMMTQTLKIKRPVVRERYHDIIDGMFE